MKERELRILNDLAAAFRDICNDCDGIPEKYVGLYDEACRAVRPLTDGQAAIDPMPTIPREVADRLLRCLSFFATTIKAGERWSETCEREYDQALAEYRKAVSDGR